MNVYLRILFILTIMAHLCQTYYVIQLCKAHIDVLEGCDIGECDDYWEDIV